MSWDPLHGPISTPVPSTQDHSCFRGGAGSGVGMSPHLDPCKQGHTGVRLAYSPHTSTVDGLPLEAKKDGELRCLPALQEQ